MEKGRTSVIFLIFLKYEAERACERFGVEKALPERLAIYYSYLFHGLDYMHINVAGWLEQLLHSPPKIPINNQLIILLLLRHQLPSDKRSYYWPM